AFVKFSVQDFGRGIPSSQKEAVFQKFKQVELSDAKRKAGTGLGLPICKQIVEQHGGYIDLESVPEKGSTFYFTLPSSKSSTVSSFVPTDVALGAKESEKKTEKDRAESAKNIQNHVAAKRPMRFPLAWQGAVLVGLPLLFELVFVIGLYDSLAQVQSQRAEELKMRDICYNSSRGLRLINEVAKSLMHNNQAHHDKFDKNQAEWDKLYAELSASIASDPSFAEVREKIDGANVRLTNTRTLLKTTGNQTANAMSLLGSLMTINKNLTAISVIAEEHEHGDPAKEREYLVHQYSLLVGGLVLNCLLSLLLCLFFAFGFSRRLVVMADNTKRLANEEELNPPIGGNDEITDLDEAFHKVSTGLLDSRRRERAIFDNCKDVLCVLSKDGKFLSFNPAVETEWAVKRSDMQDANLSSLVVPDDLPAIKELISRASDKPIEESLELKVKTGDGRIIWTSWTVSRGKGQPSSFCVVRDQTDQRQLQQLRKEFLAVVSHDLRTPLTAVMGISSLVAENCFGLVEGDARMHIVQVQRSCEMLLELINDILDLEKL
ncbi:MAG: PAS domain S-box protein, partial [Candidatus Obscuribacterales bacterium]|nr:PAS domain S-box protein [Candidatus Obscuribacterales bacterium]